MRTKCLSRGEAHVRIRYGLPAGNSNVSVVPVALNNVVPALKLSSTSEIGPVMVIAELFVTVTVCE